jgi:hypothetical protein
LVSGLKIKKRLRITLFRILLLVFASTNPILDAKLDSLFSLMISDEENVKLCAIPDEAEIFHALSHLGLTKALGPDEMMSLFYKIYWHTVKKDVIIFVQSFF